MISFLNSCSRSEAAGSVQNGSRVSALHRRLVEYSVQQSRAKMRCSQVTVIAEAQASLSLRVRAQCRWCTVQPIRKTLQIQSAATAV